MKTITNKKIKEILNKHYMWLRNEPNGVRADLSGADLRGADLRGADLRRANLRAANLRAANLDGADLSGADLYGSVLLGADLCGANLYGAKLCDANLSIANLCEADFDSADLCGVNLIGANLSRSKNVLFPIACPEKSSFIAFKKAGNHIVELEIPEDALRCSAFSRKCRCSKAKVISITTIDGQDDGTTEIHSDFDKNFIYKIGEMVKVDDFDTNRWRECSTGIHFFYN